MEGRLTEAQCWKLFERLFPGGLADLALLQELAPEGWERSPLVRVFHPTIEQAYEEAVRMHENLRSLRSDAPPLAEDPPPSLEEIRREHRDAPVRPREECADLLGWCLWDIFSDNHDVFTAEGLQVDLGSFRASAGFIADFVSRRESPDGLSLGGRDYMDFYMGTALVGHRADLTPVYELAFRRMKRLGLDWRYVHPRLHLIDFGLLREEIENEGKPEWLGYDPSQAVAREQEERKRQRELADLRADLDKAYQESVEEARRSPPPPTVLAYRNVYGRWPAGWPPTAGRA
jgi:hypothetical protein